MSNDHQVFVDDTGKRKIAFNAITWTAGLAIAAFTVLLLVSLTSSPATNDSQEIDYRATVPSSTTAQAVLPHQEGKVSTSSEPLTRQLTSQTTASIETTTTSQTSTSSSVVTTPIVTTIREPAPAVTQTTPEGANGTQSPTAKGRTNKVPPGLVKKAK